MNVAGFLWGVGGILLLLGFAVLRLGAVALEALSFPLDAVHWAALLAWTPYMIWAEGYKGFYRGFAPRVVARARHLAGHPRPLHVLLAPLYCMGYIHATRKRQLLSLSLTTMIVFFVLVVRMLPQPWRGIVDTGVVAGLVLGMLSIAWFLYRAWQNPAALTVPTDVPRTATPETARAP